MLKTIASICSGGGILEQGAIAAGLTPIWGVEINPRVAELYRLNYQGAFSVTKGLPACSFPQKSRRPDSKMIVQDACTVDWDKLDKPDILHASPSCRSFSAANNKSEAKKDIAVAEAVAKAIATFQPEIFTLENVAAYANSASWSIILNLLQSLGYQVSAEVHQMKFWGIPQKRRNRFIAIASKGQFIKLSVPNRLKYWYEEIKDLIPFLEESNLTNTQIAKLTEKTKFAIAKKGEAVLLKRNQIRAYTPAAIQSEPYCWTVTATLCSDQREGDRRLFADLFTPQGIFSLDTRCLARIQTIPDSYQLSGQIAIDGLAIGDGVPSYFAQQMYEQILELPNAYR